MIPLSAVFCGWEVTTENSNVYKGPSIESLNISSKITYQIKENPLGPRCVFLPVLPVSWHRNMAKKKRGWGPVGLSLHTYNQKCLFPLSACFSTSNTLLSGVCPVTPLDESGSQQGRALLPSKAQLGKELGKGRAAVLGQNGDGVMLRNPQAECQGEDDP